MRFFYSTQLSEHIVETPEGFLLCLDVPIARTGWQEYGPDETTVEAGDDGVVRVIRLPEEVFDPAAMASFEGKPLVVDHPGVDVTPANWRGLAMGHAQNVHRGEGDAADLLLADLLAMDERAIGLILGGLREISCGYDAEYEQTGPGWGRQRQIRGNHVALVAQGRCGGRCRINDNHNEDEDMATTKKKSFADKFLDVFRRPEVRSALDSMEEPVAPPAKKEEEQPSPTDQEPDRISALEQQVGELTLLVRKLLAAEQEEQAQGEDPEAPASDEEPDAPCKDEETPAGPATKDRAAKGKARDARTRDTRTVDKDTMDRAVVLMPGIRLAATDSRCVVQRTALRTATQDAAVGKIVAGALRGATLDTCDCMTLDAAFLAASEFMRERNNLRTGDVLARATARDFGKPTTPADINKANREFHKKGA